MTTEATLQDLERTAALLEGRLSGAERDAAIARIEADDDLREVFADLVRFSAASAAETAPAPQVQPAARWWGWRRIVPLAAAAAIAVVVLLPRRDGWTRPLTVDRLTPAIDSATLSFSGDWYQHAWDGPRGTSLGLQRTDSFRLGVRVQELAIAVAANRKDDADALCQHLAAMVPQLPDMQVATTNMLDGVRSGEPRTILASRLTDIDHFLAGESKVDGAAFALGKWAAAGRLAAMTGAEHAIPAAPDELLEQAERLSRSDADRSRALVALQTALAHDDQASRSQQATAFAGWIDSF